jgi:ribosome-associated protein
MKDLVLEAVDDAKGQNPRVLDVRGLTDITDFMVVVTGTSDRHIKSVAERVADALRERGCRPLGTEGEDSRDWVLIDFGDVVVHVMTVATRAFYDLERLWGVDLRAHMEARRERGGD